MNTQAETAPERLQRLRKRAKLSMDVLAKEMGYKAASSIQRYMDPRLHGGGHFQRDFVEKLAAALVGKGEPQIRSAEVWALAGPEFAEIAERGDKAANEEKAASTADKAAKLMNLFTRVLNSDDQVLKDQTIGFLERRLNESQSDDLAITTRHVE